jgi:hypothetical protein
LQWHFIHNLLDNCWIKRVAVFIVHLLLDFLAILFKIQESVLLFQLFISHLNAIKVIFFYILSCKSILSIVSLDDGSVGISYSTIITSYNIF